MTQDWNELNYEQAVQALNEVDAALREVNHDLKEYQRKRLAPPLDMTKLRQHLVGQVHALQRRVRKLRPVEGQVPPELLVASAFMAQARIHLTDEVYSNLKERAEEALRYGYKP